MKKFAKKNIEDILSLTPMQEGMLFHYIKDPGSLHYCEQLSLEISGEIDCVIFEKTWNFVVDTNEMLRTIFRWEKLGNPFQVILKKHRLQPGFFDLSGEDNREKKKKLLEIKTRERNKKFNLREVPFRVTLIRTGKSKYEMIIGNHHIIYDGWSNGIILEEFFKAYHDLANGKDPHKPLKTKFKEFIKWNQARHTQEREKSWRNHLTGFDSPTELAIKKRNTPGTTGTGKYQIKLENHLKNKLADFVKARKLTTASLLYSSWGLLLQKYNNSDDVIFGTVVSGRSAKIEKIEEIVGLLINTIPLRIKTGAKDKIADILDRVLHTLRMREEYENTPLVEIKKYSQLDQIDELFDTVVIIENYPLDSRLKPGNGKLSIEKYTMLETTHYDISVAIEMNNETRFIFTYNKERFEEETIVRMGHHLKGLVQKIITEPGKPVSELEIAAEQEKHRVLYEFNRPARVYTGDKTIPGIFAEQVSKTPDSTAIVGQRYRHVTYGQIKQDIRQLAGKLIEKGIKANDIVAIMMERSIKMVIGILGILEAGAAYLPIEPETPQERIDYMLKDSSAKILLTRQEIAGHPLEFPASRLPLFSSPPLARLAYIIYTSGSTGQPRGVVVEQPPVVNVLNALQEQYPFTEKDVYLFKTAVVFDVSVTELLGWFFGGGRLALLEKGGEKDPGKILETIAAAGVTHINFVPSMFNAFVEVLNHRNAVKLSTLKYIFLAGEALLPALVTRFTRLKTAIKLENLYGPTEGTVYAGKYSLGEWEPGGEIPIGKPLRNVEIYILDRNDHIQPLAIPGELCITGAGIARGYLNNPALTNSKFQIKNQKIPGKNHMQPCSPASMPSLHYPITPLPQSPLYRSGDLARWRPDGNIEFLGRLDHQVKIRGFRIEPGEIEKRLFDYDQIKQAVVTINEDKNGDRYLCAYIVSQTPGPMEISHLQSHLAQKLPAYMVPAYFVQLQHIPLTPTGKVDRKALPQPEIIPGTRYTAPRDKIEAQLLEIWSGVLGIPTKTIGIDHNFFKMGGHSLKAARLLARIHKKMEVEIPLARLFAAPTVSGLAQCIHEIRKKNLPPVQPAEKKEYYELSPSQERFFVFWQWRPGNISYNISEIMLMEGPLAGEKLAAVFKQLIRRHEILRTSFHLLDGQPVQRIHDKAEFAIEHHKLEPDRSSVLEGTRALAPLPGEPAAHSPQPATDIISSFIRPFDLTRAPLVRLGIAHIREEKYFLMFDIHHIVSDGVSIGIFIKECLEIYAGQQHPPPRIQYKDYAQWQRKKKKKKNTPPQTKNQQTALNLPLDFPRPVEPDFKGKTVLFKIEGMQQAANLLSLKEEFTLYMVLLAAFNVFLTKISGQEEIVVGSPIAGRRHPDLENLIGLFINPLALRNFPAAPKPYIDFLAEVKKNALHAYENQDHQYDDMLEKMIAGRKASHNPLYDVMFVLQNMEMPAIEIPGIKVTRQLGDYPAAKFDMTLGYEEFSNFFNLEYSTALFKPETIQRFIGYFKNVVGQILENPQQTIAEIEIISPQEKQRILYDFNDTAVAYPQDRCIYQLITRQAQQTPDRTAIIQNQPEESGTKPVTLTYRQINTKTNRIARLLRKRGIKTNTVVGIMMNSSREMLEGILGILKAGGTYLPVDAQYPENRIDNMLKNSRAACLLTHRTVPGGKSFPNTNPEQPRQVEIILMDEIARECEKEPGNNIKPHSTPDDMIYIIFTSGSTGTPKGAGVKHRGFVNLMHWFVTEFALNPHDRNLLLTSPSFDLTQKNFYAPLISGGQFCIPAMSYFEPRLLVKLIQENQITWINCTPGMFNKLVEYKTMNENKQLSSLRYVFLGGEPVSMPPLVDWLESGDSRAEIVNTYGPTECTDISNFYRIKQPRRFLEEPVPIGKPVNNVRLYVPDKNMRPQPVGIAGELLIGGAGLGSGYIDDETLTTRKFIKHSFDPNQPQQLLYRTGDLVKWQPDGNIEFLGRIDHQVKVRGFRIELGEIENQLHRHPDVKEALVMAREDETGEKYLCAYIVPRVPRSTGTAHLKTTEIRGHLSRELPDYMVPAYIMELEKMPMNPNGKLDRKALPKPDLTGKNHYVPPENDTEKRLTEIWAQVLGLDKKQVSIHDNFFQSGGHSLKAVTLIGKIHKVFRVEIPIAEIFKQPTIKNIGQYLEQGKESPYTSIVPREKKEYYPLSSAQKRLYIIERMDPGQIAYNIPVVLKLAGKIDRDRLTRSFKKLITRHESLRTSFDLVGEEPVQRIHDKVEFELQGTRGLAPLSGSGEPAAPGTQPPAALISAFTRPFDLSCAPLLRAGMIDSGENSAILVVDMHHIVTDGKSMEILTGELAALYTGKHLPEMRIQYKDYSETQTNSIQTGKVKTREDYWKTQYREEVPGMELPIDYDRPAIQGYEGSTARFKLGKEKTRELKELAIKENVTMFVLLLAVYKVFLSKLSSREDIVVGTPAACRKHNGLQGIIGMLINTLAIRTYPKGNKTFTTYLKEIKKNMLEALENQDYPFEELVENLAIPRDISRNPLFASMFTFNEKPPPQLEIPGLNIKPYEQETRISKFDLSLTGEELQNELHYTFEYNTKLFKKETIARLIAYIKKVHHAIIKNPGMKLAHIEIITTREKRKQLEEFNTPPQEYPRNKTMHMLIEDREERNPDRIALKGVETGSKKRDPIHITYREMREKSRRLARILQGKGVGPDIIVGILLEPSEEMIITILGIMKANGAYLPIDPGTPKERIEFMMKDSNAKILLTKQEITKTHPPTPLPFYPSQSANLAYVIYTSGSTGNPKAVAIEHHSIVEYISAIIKKLEIRSHDIVLQQISISFDASMEEIYPTLVKGARLVIVPRETVRKIDRFAAIIERECITMIGVSPLLLDEINKIQEKKLQTIRRVLVGGDVLRPGNINKIVKNTDVYNTYGPTEATVCATYYKCKPNETGNIPIGKPIGNTTVYIGGNNHEFLPIGTPGQILIGGEGLARGYINHPELTAEKFCLRRPGGALFEKTAPPGPPRKNFSLLKPPGKGRYMSCSSCSSYILYKSGDIGKWRPEGNIEFLGRMDNQIKIKGYRIELGEIENRLLKQEGIKEAAVVVKPDINGDKYLCAYIAAKQKFTQTDLREYLTQTMPGYMIPAYFVHLEKMPLTPGGKINRTALTALPVPGQDTGQENNAPKNRQQEKLVQIWQEILLGKNEKNKHIGINDNFFQLGGHSIKAVRLVSRIHSDMGTRVPLLEIFKRQTIKELAEYIKNAAGNKYPPVELAETKEYYPLSSAQKRLYILEKIGNTGNAYNLPGAWQIRGTLEPARMQHALTTLIKRHESLRTSFHMLKNQPVQKIHRKVEFEIEYDQSLEDCQSRGGASSPIHVEKIIRDFIRPFDLTQAPLLRLELVKTPANQQLLLLDMHHIITDGYSFNIFISDFITLYKGKELPAIRIQYKDFSAWQNQWWTGQKIKEQEEYWQQQYRDEIPGLKLPTDNPRPTRQDFAGDNRAYRLEEPICKQLQALARETGTTLNMILLAVFGILLAKYSRQEDVVVGLPALGRTHPDFENIIGFFVNTLALRSKPGSAKTFEHYLQEIRAQSWQAYENQDYPFDDLVNLLEIPRNNQRNPLLDVLFVSENTGMPEISVEGLRFQPYAFKHPITHMDLVLYFTEAEQTIQLVLEYSTALYKEETAKRMLEHYAGIITQVVENRKIAIKDIAISHKFRIARPAINQEQDDEFIF